MDSAFLDILIWQPVVKSQQLLQSSPRSDRQVELQAVLTSTYYLMSQYDPLAACAAWGSLMQGQDGQQGTTHPFNLTFAFQTLSLYFFPQESVVSFWVEQPWPES